MKTNYTNEYAACTVQANPLLPVGTLELSALATDAEHQGQGYATELLQAVCRDADIDGVVLVLSPMNARLQAFYKRFGFTEIQPRPVLMARMPQVFKVKMSMTNAAALSAIHG